MSSQHVQNIVLVGLMGTGKSTIGQRLAQRLQWRFVDTDQLLEEHYGITISEMFARWGEPGFRDAETGIIERTMAAKHQIIATGGGAVLAARNRETMLGNGYVVALSADAQTIIDRVRGDQSRPLLHGDLEQRVHAIMEQRKHAYDFAPLQIDTSGREIEEIVDDIERSWNRFVTSD